MKMKEISEVINGKDITLYTWPDYMPFRPFLIHDKCRIFFIANICHNYNWLKTCTNYIRENDYFVVESGWYVNRQFAELADDIFSHLKLDKNKFILLCNDYKELKNYREYGFSNSILFNNNAWLDYNLYSIMNLNVLYRAILIGRADPLKRLYLASKVDQLALITGGFKCQEEEVKLPPHINKNDRRLTFQEITEYINQSRCGLCLSAAEGACYVSSEYLLCGVPVVSTVSLGGRDIWYDEENCIICRDNEIAVKEAVELVIRKKINHTKIRNRHIELSIFFRDIFISKFQEILNVQNIRDIDARRYINNNYINKMSYDAKEETVINMVKNRVYDTTQLMKRA